MSTIYNADMPRKILKAKVRFISLCPRGANRLPVMYKEENGQRTVEIDTLVKAADGFAEKGELLAVVYAPNIVDAEGDFADAETVRDMMFDFAKSGEGIDFRHNGRVLAKDQAFVAESFEIQKGDPRFVDFKDRDGKPVDVTGGWGMLIKVDDPYLRALYKSGDWDGVSVGGEYLREAAKSEDAESLLSRLLHKLLHKTNPSSPSGDIDMTEETLTKTLNDNNKSLTAALIEGLTKVLKPESKLPEFAGDLAKAEDRAEYAKKVAEWAGLNKTETTAASTPAKKPDEKLPYEITADGIKFTGDPLSKEDLTKFLAAKKALDAAAAVDWDDAQAVEEYTKSLPDKPAAGKGKAKSNSHAAPATDVEASRLAKEEDECIAEMSAYANGEQWPPKKA